MATTKDISIGENKQITWVDIDQINDDAIIEIDHLFNPTLEFWNRLEIRCMSECCGIDAFSFWEDDIRRAINGLDSNQIIAKLIKMKLEVEQSSKAVVSSDKLNSYLEKTVFIQLVDHILITLDSK